MGKSNPRKANGQNVSGEILDAKVAPISAATMSKFANKTHFLKKLKPVFKFLVFAVIKQERLLVFC